MQIQIGPIHYDVVLVPELANGEATLHGDINHARCRIRICADDSPQLQHVTLWHEVLHGILHLAALDDHSEQLIIALAYGIVQALRDNPVLHGGLDLSKVNPSEIRKQPSRSFQEALCEPDIPQRHR